MQGDIIIPAELERRAGGIGEESLRQGLRDAGCGRELIDQVLSCWNAGRGGEALRLLRRHKGALLKQLHDSERRVDCLDYCVYQMKRSMEPKSGKDGKRYE